ncbi:Hypothetical_protein [Hexamita inflata]|uniref:Hypothetical_protein n=1 Tax=Hexamita inflata TaxID=28002 RepID=A0AA86R0H0_9EUKA|nr:Hypothetical protein HINF_LOCUS55003 [Hexamita inflata]
MAVILHCYLKSNSTKVYKYKLRFYILNLQVQLVLNISKDNLLLRGCEPNEVPPGSRRDQETTLRLWFSEHDSSRQRAPAPFRENLRDERRVHCLQFVTWFFVFGWVWAAVNGLKMIRKGRNPE